MGTVYAGCDGYGLCRVLWVRFMQGVMGTVYAGYDGYGLCSWLRVELNLLHVRIEPYFTPRQILFCSLL